MKKLTTSLLTGSALLLFTACGGGGGSSGGSTPTTVNPNGLWVGTQVVNGVSSDAQYIIYNNEIYGYSIGSYAMFSGYGSVNDNSLSANYNIYDVDTGYAIGSGSTTGTVVEQSSISGSFSNSLGQNGTLNLAFNYEYNNPSSLTYITGNVGGISISPSGAISGYDGSCSVNGRVTTPDTSINIYAIEYTLGNCPVSGYYSGLGTIVNQNGSYIFQSGMTSNNSMHLFAAYVPKPSTF